MLIIKILSIFPDEKAPEISEIAHTDADENEITLEKVPVQLHSIVSSDFFILFDEDNYLNEGGDRIHIDQDDYQKARRLDYNNDGTKRNVTSSNSQVTKKKLVNGDNLDELVMKKVKEFISKQNKSTNGGTLNNSIKKQRVQVTGAGGIQNRRKFNANNSRNRGGNTGNYNNNNNNGGNNRRFF